jgi:hypothetical protein
MQLFDSIMRLSKSHWPLGETHLTMVELDKNNAREDSNKPKNLILYW